MQTLREQVVEFLKSEHQKTGKTPSIRGICKKFGLSNRALYEAFPGRKPEMCECASVPEDADSFQKVAKANQALKVKREKDQLADKELAVLKQREDEKMREVKQEQMIDETRKRIGQLYGDEAKTTTGLEAIFSSKEKLREFTLNVIQDSEILKRFLNRCNTNNLPLDETLAAVVGSLDEYLSEISPVSIDLSDYIDLKLESYLADELERESHCKRQAAFSGFLLGFRCPDCNTSYESMVINGTSDRIACMCGTQFTPICPGCKGDLRFDLDSELFSCPRCAVTYERPTIQNQQNGHP